MELYFKAATKLPKEVSVREGFVHLITLSFLEYALIGSCEECSILACPHSAFLYSCCCKKWASLEGPELEGALSSVKATIDLILAVDEDGDKLPASQFKDFRGLQLTQVGHQHCFRLSFILLTEIACPASVLLLSVVISLHLNDL